MTDAMGNVDHWTFDAAGNLISGMNSRNQYISYSYDTGGRLAQKLLPDGSRVSFVYDTRGNLSSMTDTTGTTQYTFDSQTDKLTKLETPDGHWLSFTYCTCGRRSSSQSAVDFSAQLLTLRTTGQLPSGSGNRLAPR